MSRAAFTMIEVLATLLIITLGMLAVVGMVLYASALAHRAQAACTGMATALTVLDDPTPITTLDWAHPGGSDPSCGYLNGWYVIRRTAAAEPIAGGLASVLVSVEVYETMGGALVTSVASRRVVRR